MNYQALYAPARLAADTGGGGVQYGAHDDGGGGGWSAEYAPIEPTVPSLTAAQVQDLANACTRAVTTGQPAPLARPFRYRGPNVPGFRDGDSIHEMVQTPHGCATNAEAARLYPDPDAGISSRTLVIGAVGIVLVAAGLWGVFR